MIIIRVIDRLLSRGSGTLNPSSRLLNNLTEVHRPGVKEYLYYFVQGLIISVALTFFFENMARGLVTDFFSTQMAGFVLIVVLAPIIEEYFKVYPLFSRHAETARSQIRLGFFSGLGFGISEFFVYVFLVGAPVSVRLPGLLFHAASTSIAASGFSKHQFLQFYAIAVILHAVNNFFAELGDIWFFGGLATVLLAYILAYREYSTAEDEYTIAP